MHICTYVACLDVAGHGPFHWHIHRMERVLATLNAVTENGTFNKPQWEENRESFYKRMKAAKVPNFRADNYLVGIRNELRLFAFHLKPVQNEFEARVKQYLDDNPFPAGISKKMWLGNTSLLLKRNDGYGGILHQDLLTQHEKAFLMPLVEQEQVPRITCIFIVLCLILLLL
jgi:hypothetical protein